MLRRILLLTFARLNGEWFGEKGGSLPIAPIVFQGVISCGLFWLVKGDLDAHGHAIFALSLLLALSLLSLLGELAPLLASDPAEEWVGGLPVTAREIRLSKISVCLLVSWAMSLSVLIPALLFAPEGFGVVPHMALLALGLIQVVGTTALALVLHAVLQGKRTGILVLIQAVLFVGLFVGFVAGLGRADLLAGWDKAQGLWHMLPSVWYAAPLAPDPQSLATALAIAAALASFGILAFAPFPQKARAVGTQSILGTLLSPIFRLARRFWVRPQERPVFDWIFHGLPAEKDFGLRTYPLMAIPFAFLFLGADGSNREGLGLLAILSFAPLTYLPILLLFVPTTQTPAARVWIDASPLSDVQEQEGALKAIAVRILLPLYALLAVVIALVANWKLALHLIPPAAAMTVIFLRPLWKHYVKEGALSTPAQDLGGVWRDDLTGGMFFLAVVSVVLALLTWKYIPGPIGGVVFAAVVLLLEWLRNGSHTREPKASPLQTEEG